MVALGSAGEISSKERICTEVVPFKEASQEILRIGGRSHFKLVSQYLLKSNELWDIQYVKVF